MGYNLDLPPHPVTVTFFHFDSELQAILDLQGVGCFVYHQDYSIFSREPLYVNLHLSLLLGGG